MSADGHQETENSRWASVERIPRRTLHGPDAELGAHMDMSNKYDGHLKKRGDLDRLLGQLSLDGEALRSSVDSLLNGARIESTTGQQEELETVAVLETELAMLNAQVAAVKRIAAQQADELSQTEHVVNARRAGLRRAFCITDLRAALSEIGVLEHRIRRLEDERLQLTQAAWQHTEILRSIQDEYSAEGAALREQLVELTTKADDLERQIASASQQSARQVSPTSGSAATHHTDPSGYLTASGAAGGAVRETEQLLRKEIDFVNVEIAAIEDALNREAALVDGSPRERILHRELPPSGLAVETLVRIMQLLKASLFNVDEHITLISDTVADIYRDRDMLQQEYDKWRRTIVGDAFSNAARFVHQPYDTDAAIAERMIRKLRRLVLVCDTVEGLTPEWVVEFAARRGIALEISQFYEVAMECFAVISEQKRRRKEMQLQKKLTAHMATRGKVFASLGMRRASTSRASTSRTPSQMASGYMESDEDVDEHE